MDTNEKSVSADMGSENKDSYCCCGPFLKSKTKSEVSKSGTGEQNTVNEDNNANENASEAVVVQESPVTQQPITSQPLHVPDEVATDQNGSVNPPDSTLDIRNSMRENGQVAQTESTPNKYKSVKEYMKVENFMNEF